MLVFHCKLHTIPDNSLEDGLKKYSNISSLVFIMGFGVFAQYVFYFFIPSENKSHNEIDIILHHFLYLILSTFWFIFVPKCYIKQNSNLSFYVSVYHQQPPPVLPWQLPNNFDPKSVKLEIAGGSILQYEKSVILAEHNYFNLRYLFIGPNNSRTQISQTDNVRSFHLSY